MANPGTAPIRRWIVRTTIGSFSLAALMGIIALLGSGDFGEFEGRILLTTLLVGVVSIAVLCYLATAGRRSQPVGIAGGVVVIVPLVCALVMIWSDWSGGPREGLVRTFGVGSIVAATLAQACLLLALCDQARSLVRRLLTATLALAAVLAGLTSLMVLGYEPEHDLFLRVLGVVAILDVLGTVVVAALVKFGPAAPTAPDALETRLAQYVAARGTTRDAVVAEALTQFLDAAEHHSRSGSTTAG